MINVAIFEMMAIRAFDGGGLCNDAKSSNGKVVNSLHV
jgi:hypothetical protein